MCQAKHVVDHPVERLGAVYIDRSGRFLVAPIQPQHQLELGAVYTARRLPVALLWAADFESVVDAFAFEKQVQNWSRAKRQALIDGRLGDLPGLARGRTGYMKRGPGFRPTSPGLG